MATVIYNVNGLQAMNDDLTLDYELFNDIYASATSGWNEDPESPGTYFGFDPIGSPDTEFTGSFDGKGYTINDLFINRPTEDFVGLFGETDESGEIKNVGLVDCDITGDDWVGALIGRHDAAAGKISFCWSSGAIKGGNEIIGGLVGISYGDMEGCYSTCSVTATGGARDVSTVGGLVGSIGGTKTVTRCYATGNITVTSDEDIDQIGSLIGYTANATISKCYATGDVSVTVGEDADEIGAFIGTAASNNPIRDCYARGAVTVSAGIPANSGDIGGFVGLVDDIDSVIDNCYSIGLLTVTDGVPDVGGFCGDNYGTITNCFWDRETSGTATSDGGTHKTTAEMKTKATFTDAGWDFDTVWHITTNRNNGYPLLLPPGWRHAWVGEATSDRLAFIAELGKQTIVGTATGSTGDPRQGWVEGDYLHWVDLNGAERRQKGKSTGATGTPYQAWIDDLRLRYIDSSGNVRHLGTWIIGQSRLGIDTILHA